MKKSIKSETATVYTVEKNTTADNKIIAAAIKILEKRAKKTGIEITSPQATYDFLKLQLAESEQEIFGVMFLDTRHRLISFDAMFYGTIDGASVHPREVVKRALQHNAAAVIFSHNHPSGITEPSNADIQITAKLKSALALIDIRVLDHIIVGPAECTSLAQRGNL